MSGTIDGGNAAAQKNKELYGKDFYARIGSAGGKAKVAKGFALNRDLARQAGARGGRLSRRSTKKRGA
jgi:hypothetical protein